MSLANDSILVTPGSGATVATHTAGAKEHQVVMCADQSGEIAGSKPTYIVESTNQINVAAASTIRFDLFNATGSGKIVKVVGLFIIPALVAVTGVGLTWSISKTSAVGTGGTGLTAHAVDSGNAAVPAEITAMAKPTGGATPAFVWQTVNSSSEETNPYASLASQLNHVPWASQGMPQVYTLREGEGISVTQTTSSSVGNTNIVVVFTLE